MAPSCRFTELLLLSMISITSTWLLPLLEMLLLSMISITLTRLLLSELLLLAMLLLMNIVVRVDDAY